MYLRFPELLVIVLALGGCAAAPAQVRVCADPNNLPFSNAAEQGFENRIAQLLADDINAQVHYTWWAQRRGFVRNTLNADSCDIIMGVPFSFELAWTSRPYYRSTYVFVSRADRAVDITSFDDPRLRKLKIGVQLIGDDYANTPPAQALANRGIINNIVGYTVYGDYSKPNPPARIVDAVVNGEVDVAVIWGPLAGYFAKLHKLPLRITPVTPQVEPPYLPMVFDISMAVRRADTTHFRMIDEFLVRRRASIDSILNEYGIPRVSAAGRSAAL